MAYTRNTMSYKKRPIRRNRRFNAKWKLGLGVRLPGGYGGNINFDSKRVKAIAKSVINKKLETKQRCVTTSVSGTHNTVYTMSPITNIAQGLDQINRLGDKIHLLNYRTRVHLYGPATANKVSYRVMVLWHDAEWATGSDAYSSARLTTSDLFITHDNALDSFLDYSKCTPLYDQIHSLEVPKQASQIVSKTFEVDIALNKDYNYKNGTNYSTRQLYTVIIPYIEGGTVGVTACGGYESQWLLTWKDA